jgi:hypothetical protein
LSQHLRLACRAKALIGADREPIKKIVDFLARDKILHTSDVNGPDMDIRFSFPTPQY